jgi:hypothetical protein
MSQSDNASLSRTATRRKIKVLVSSDRDDRELLEVLEELVRNQYFAGLAHLWAPALYRRDKALFKPFLERYLWGWQLDSTKCKEWIEQLELDGEVKLFRQVYIATLPDTDWEMREQVWTSDVLEAMKRADSPQRQRDVLRMYEMWWQIPEEVAIELYELAPSATIEYICERLDRLGEWDEPPIYDLLLARLESAGDERYWDLYGRCVSAEQWQADVLAQCAEVDDPDELDDELERRHPSTRVVREPAETFCALVEARGDHVREYVRRHVDEPWQREGPWTRLASLAAEREWWSLWREIERRFLSVEEFNETVEQLARLGQVRRLMDLAGATTLIWSGAVPQRLEPDVALMLYRSHPALVRGQFRQHLIPHPPIYDLQFSGYTDLARAALDAGDEAFVDFLTSRMVEVPYFWGDQSSSRDFAWYLEHYEECRDRPAVFARRAARVLGHCETSSSLQANMARQHNALYRAFFDDPTDFLHAPETIRDLIEASSLQVRQLGFLALGLDDDRARSVAADNLDHLLAALLEEHTRPVFDAVFSALIYIAQQQPAVASIIANRLREVANMRKPPFARPRLVQTIACLLQLNPSLQRPSERPVIYDKESA